MAVSFATVPDIKKEIERVLLEEKSGRRKTPIVIRLLAYMRDELRCVYCGVDFVGRSFLLTLDHVIPKSRGGRSHLDNLVTCCRKCNRRKADNLFCDHARQLMKTLLRQTNRNFLERLFFPSRIREILASVLASVTPAKRVLLYSEGQEHTVVEWTKECFVLRNVYTGTYVRVEKPQPEEGKKSEEERRDRRRRTQKYKRLENIMELRAVTRSDINGFA